MDTNNNQFKDFITQKNQNHVAKKKPSFIDSISLTKVTFCLLVKFDAIEKAKNAIQAPSEL
jgi:hypothetical protein